MKNNIIEKIIIEEVGVCDSFEIGNWATIYPNIKLGYTDTDYKSKYSDICYYLKKNDIISGYFMTHNKIVIDKNDIVPIYSKKLILHDFAVEGRSYIELGKMLFDFLIDFAKNNGYNAVEIKKIKKYALFNEFLTKKYKINEFNDNYYILIENPILNLSQQYLKIYEDDKINIEELYFLYDIKYMIQNSYIEKDDIKLELSNNEFIKVDRKTGLIHFPSYVKMLNDKVIINYDTKNLVFLICQMDYHNQIKNINIDYSKNNPNFFEAYDDDTVYINKDIKTILKDISYANKMIDKNIKYINSYIINYDMNDNSFSNNSGKIECQDIVKK